jgi:UDP-glucose 4-epimerase
MRILVTGGAGFIGAHLVGRLFDEGHELLVVDDLSTGSREHLPAAVPLLECDLESEQALARAAAFHPEAVVHLAARIDAAASVLDPVADARTNILATLRLLEVCRRLQPRPRIVFASSAAVYGDGVALPAVEASAGAPATPYGASKLAVEHYLGAFRRAYGLSSIALRFANVYGPRQGARGEGGVVAIFARELAAGRRPRIYGDGSQTRDFVHVRDVVEAARRALEADVQGAFNVSTGRETGVRDLFDLLARRLAPDLAPEPAPPRSGDVPRSALSYAAIASRLGWRPRIAVADGLEDTSEWFRAAAGKEPR